MHSDCSYSLNQFIIMIVYINKLYMRPNRKDQILPTKTIILPPFFKPKTFRIRSVSRAQTISNSKTARRQTRATTEAITSTEKSLKGRISSLKSITNKKNKVKASETNISEDEEETYLIPTNLLWERMKTDIKHTEQVIQRCHDSNMKKMQTIAKLFDPKTIMKMGRKNTTEQSEQKSIKQQKEKKKKFKGNLRMNQYVFEENKGESTGIQRKQECEKEEQFWKNVNQSLILNAEGEPVQFSKDLQAIVLAFE